MVRLRQLFFVILIFCLPGCGGGSSGSSGGPIPPVTVAITPSAPTLDVGTTQTFTATVTNATNTAVTWSVQEGAVGGIITATGLYTAPNTVGTYHIKAISQADTSKSATVPVVVHAKPPAVTLTITPTAPVLAVGATQVFVSNVINATNSGVAWSVQEGTAGGSIDANGLYTAPNIAGTYHVHATSLAVSTASATVPVVVHIKVSINPDSFTLTLLDKKTFTATVLGATDQGVNWKIQEGAAGGSVTSQGQYTAPNVPGTYHLVATSQHDTTQNSIAAITVQAGSASGTIQ